MQGEARVVRRAPKKDTGQNMINKIQIECHLTETPFSIHFSECMS